MLIPNQLIEIRISRSNIEHFKNLGYDVKIKDLICVPVEHLKDKSHILVWVKCDVCAKEYQKEYRNYLKQHTYNIDTCNACKNIKTKQTCMDKYGVKNVFQVEEFKNRHKETCIKRYGCKYVSQSDGWNEKYKQTMIDRYGNANPMNVQEFKEKQKNTLYAHYGVYNPLQSEEIKESVFSTNLNKYGCKSPLQNEKIKEKQIKTFYQNGTTPTSSQQLKLYSMIQQKYSNVELNYPFSRCSLDIFICVDDVNVDIEYDGSYWHQDQQNDIRRDKFLQSQGIKVLRIRSGRKLPTEKELFSAIDELVTTDHVFKEIVLSDWNSKQYKINEK